MLNNKDKVVWMYLSKKMVWEEKSKGKHQRRQTRTKMGAAV
jgi:hypothetical protein